MTDAALLERIAATTEAQRRAADPRRSVWARANAGAGKTTVLIDRMARLLLDGASPGRILGITYTKAAASHMQTKLFERLGRWTVASDAALRDDLRRLDPALQLTDTRLRAARTLFARALETPGGLKVQTIHAFCQSVLRRFPLEAGVPPGFEVAQDAQAELLALDAMRRARRLARDAFDVVTSLTSQDDDVDVVRVAAGQIGARWPGADAARTALGAWLGIADPALDPRQLRADAVAAVIHLLGPAARVLSSGKSMANDFKSAEALQTIAGLWDAGDVDGACEAMGRLLFITEGKGTPRRTHIANKVNVGAPALEALTGAFEKGEEGAVCFSGPLGDVTRAYLVARKAELLEASVALGEAAAAWRQALAESKAAMGLLDFDDLLDRTAALFQAEGAARWVLYKLDNGIDHVLLDEAQDTSPRQWDLLQPLFTALEEGAAGRARTRFVVGDDKQSIYSFQGASPERYAQEESRFLGDGVPEDAPPRDIASFAMSFRTGQVVLDAVDAVWAATRTLPEELETKFASPMRHDASRGVRGTVEVWPLTRPAEKGPEREAWDMPLDVESELSARNQLAERIALEIKARIAAGDPVWETRGRSEEPRPLRAGDIMVLFRHRNPLFHQTIRRLKAHGVPVAGADRIRLLDDVGVQDLLALARFALCPGDDFNLACVLKGAFCGLVDDDADLFPLAHGRGESSLWQRVQDSADPAVRAIARDLTQLLALGGAVSPHRFLSTVLEEPWHSGKTGWRLLIERLGREVREPVEALLQRALDHGRGGPPGLAAFLSALETQNPDVKRELDAAPGAAGGGVRVMTVHGAKGLEAPMVILPDTTGAAAGGRDSVLPGPVEHGAEGTVVWLANRAWKCPELEAHGLSHKALAVEEAARLLYVGMTRARDHLIICGAHAGSGKDGYASPSWWSWITAGLKALPPTGLRDLVSQSTQTAESARVWGALPPAPTAGSVIGTAQDPPAIPDWIDRAPRETGRSVRRIAPSALGQNGAARPVIAPTGPEAAARLRRGTLIHRLLQWLPELEPGARAAAAGRFLAVEGRGLPEGMTGEIMASVLAVLDHPEFAPLFGPGSRAEATLAGRGPGLPDGLWVAGTVDRLVVTQSEVLIVDYKTSRMAPERPDDVEPGFLAQMAAYRTVAQAAWPRHRVRCALVWTDGPGLMSLPDHLLDEALARLRAAA